jgi:hypothetical protein
MLVLSRWQLRFSQILRKISRTIQFVFDLKYVDLVRGLTFIYTPPLVRTIYIFPLS